MENEEREDSVSAAISLKLSLYEIDGETGDVTLERDIESGSRELIKLMGVKKAGSGPKAGGGGMFGGLGAMGALMDEYESAERSYKLSIKLA